MNKLYIIFFTVLLIPIFVSTASAQIIQTDVSMDDMDDIDDSKYRASGVSVIRNADGDLISLAKVDAGRYLDHPIIDEFLKNSPLAELVNKGKLGKDTVSHDKVEVLYRNPICADQTFDVPGFYDKCDWHHRAFNSICAVTQEEIGYQIFMGLNHNFLVKSGYEVITYWDVFTRD